jgi:hypothetical protein
MIFSETSSTGAPRLPTDLLICLRVCPDARYALFAGFTVAGKTSLRSSARSSIVTRKWADHGGHA